MLRLRILLLLLASLSLAPLSGCESCGFTYGAVAVPITVQASIPPKNLHVTICDEPDEQYGCSEAWQDSYDPTLFQGSVGAIECGFVGGDCQWPSFHVLVTADNCQPITWSFPSKDIGTDPTFYAHTATLDCT
jgi:hypothetical protein